MEAVRTLMYQRHSEKIRKQTGLRGSFASSDPSQIYDVLDRFITTGSVPDCFAGIERVLGLPGGHSVLIGPPGSGK